MNPYLILLMIALLYILIVGGLSALRREGFSLQFAVEVVAVTGFLMIVSPLIGQVIHPVFYLVIIYLITMRARLIVDLGNLLAQRGYHQQAANLYSLALKSRPDSASRQIVMLNQAVHQLKRDRPAQAISTLENLLTDPGHHLSPKHEAAARYNLAVGHQRQGNEAKAIVEFNKVIDVMPGSLYASGAQVALEKRKRQKALPDEPRD